MLYRLSTGLMSEIGGAKWVAKDNIHLTLKFLGPTPEDKLDDLEKAIREATEAFRKFYFSLGEIGAFPNTSRPRVIWVGVHHGGAELSALNGAIECAIEPLGFQTEEKRFTPHITLARVKEPKALDDPFKRIPPDTVSGHTVNVDFITIFKSDLRRTGAEYTPLCRISLNP